MGWGEDTKETKNALHARNIYPREAGRDECQTTKRIPVPFLFTRPHTEEAHLLSIQYGARSKHDMSRNR